MDDTSVDLADSSTQDTENFQTHQTNLAMGLRKDEEVERGKIST